MMMNISTRYRITSSRVLLSTILTSVILLCQLLLFHYYYRSISYQYSGGQTSKNRLESVYCSHGLLAGIQELAINSDVELVLVDPDVVEQATGNQEGEEEGGTYHHQEEFSFSKKSQESTHKSILHLAAINETSGGQPNLKLFYESLKNNGYITIQYDLSWPMQPEVYRRSSHLFEDAAHELHDNDQGAEKISKIYTEFIAHIFVLNHTSSSLPEKDYMDRLHRCNRKQQHQSQLNTVIHIFVLYNYEYDRENKWIQPALIMDELDKHKLLIYNVHWVDFRIPFEHHYLHSKRSTISIHIAKDKDKDKEKNKERTTTQLRGYTIDFIKVFESVETDDRVLNYVNNSFVYCKMSPFSISGLIDNRRKYGKYSMLLDNSRPVKSSPSAAAADERLKTQLEQQIDLALQFMNTFSNVYGKFSYWLTGSSLLSYLKFCDLVTILDDDSAATSKNRILDDMSQDGNSAAAAATREPMISLELGVFASEFNDTVLEDLAKATDIGVKMISDWRKTNPVIHFKLANCPNILFRLYPYELRKDFYEYYFRTQNSMLFNQRRTRKRSTTTTKTTMLMTMMSNKASPNSKSFDYDTGGFVSSWEHHVFGLHNTELCWTHIDGISQLFRVPCNIYDHLRRIFII